MPTIAIQQQSKTEPFIQTNTTNEASQELLTASLVNQEFITKLCRFQDRKTFVISICSMLDFEYLYTFLIEQVCLECEIPKPTVNITHCDDKRPFGVTINGKDANYILILFGCEIMDRIGMAKISAISSSIVVLTIW